MTKKPFIAASPSMKKLFEDLPRLASSSASIFINGESGTGKEVVAHAIHYFSNREKGPFVKVNCAAIPESLIESEFFGHEKGAFTGAISRRLGRFELANQGTLLLDEISEVPLSVQSKLLRAVQEQEFERIGGINPVHVNVRFISTSNRKMNEAVKQGLFREDLYYRLNVVPIYLPPLRERKDDILPLAQHFLTLHETKKNLSQDAKEKLIKYEWPGNVRELSNVIERTVVMSQKEVIDAEDLLLEIPIQKASFIESHRTELKEVERLHILKVLSSYNNNKTRAAKALGISIRTLRNKLALYR